MVYNEENKLCKACGYECGVYDEPFIKLETVIKYEKNTRIQTKVRLYACPECGTVQIKI